MSAQEIEAEITKLSLKNLLKLSTWFEAYQAQRWDQQIEGDLIEGRLDAILDEVDTAYEAGLAQPL